MYLEIFAEYVENLALFLKTMTHGFSDLIIETGTNIVFRCLV